MGGCYDGINYERCARGGGADAFEFINCGWLLSGSSECVDAVGCFLASNRIIGFCSDHRNLLRVVVWIIGVCGFCWLSFGSELVAAQFIGIHFRVTGSSFSSLRYI